MRVLALFLLELASAAATGNSAAGQVTVPADTIPDSSAVRASMRSEQNDFERLRIARFPSRFQQSGVGCQETIGRFCHWDDGDDEQETNPPIAEHEDVVAARIELVAALGSAAARFPGDGWIAGLLVHYRLEQQDYEGAIATAESCEAQQWWCDALLGYAFHSAGDFGASMDAFHTSLAEMPYGQRCEWNDVGPLLDRDLRAEYTDMRCSVREPTHEAIWDLADPLYIVPGNDRYTENLSRRVIIEIMKDATTPFYQPWGPDLREIVMRFGWPVSWEKNATPRAGGPSVVSRGRPGGREFFPPASVLLAENGTGAAWDLNRSDARSSYLPSYLRRVGPMNHQIGIFRRGDSTVVAAAYSFPEFVQGESNLEAALTIVQPGEGQTQVYNSASASHDFLIAISTDSTMIVGLEVYSARDSIAGWVRMPAARPLIPSNGLGISDVLLFRPREPLPESVEEAAFLAYNTTTIKPNETLGLYWEVYGVTGTGDEVTTEVTVVREGRGLFRGLFETVGLARPRNPEVRYEWADGTGDVTAVFPRAVVVDLNDTEPGNYIVRVVATPRNGEPAIAERRIEVSDND